MCHICDIKGVNIGNKVVYPSEQFQLYTREDINNIFDTLPGENIVEGYYDVPIIKEVTPYPQEQVSIDYMHVLFTNHFKLLIDIYKKKFGTRFLKDLDQRYMKQHLPSFTRKSIRSIEQNIQHFKSNELFILFNYFTPIFKFIINIEDYNNLKLIIYIIDQLSKPISTSKLKIMDQLLLNYIHTFKILYGSEYLVTITHLIVHASRIV